ncbi:MAG TPA: hypothetical protein VGS10_23670 [Terracidiphilus sp.]|nr:hypothetical protein [Terracidiphilus sp.]
MDKLDPESHKAESSEDGDPPKGPSLILMYSLIALALLVAFAIAAIIVLPFYERR